MSDTHYYFLPFFRQGLATAISDEYDENGRRVKIPVSMNIKLTRKKVIPGVGPIDVEDEENPPAHQTIEPNIYLYGPGDILGFSPRIVSRLEPRHDVGDFEPNYFPCIEFADPDFPWRFTPTRHAAHQKLLPWITLIVLKADGDKEFNAFHQAGKGEKKVSWIENVRAGTLPDLTASWKWAHAQVTADSGHNTATLTNELIEIERSTPWRSVSRLVCARRLEPGSLYRAFVVPTFKASIAAAGLVRFEDMTSSSQLAWEGEGQQNALPFYYSWEFRTGERGDFESLVRLLVARELTGMGKRNMDCENPGYNLHVTRTGLNTQPDYHVLEMEGALQSLEAQFSVWGRDRGEEVIENPFQESLAQLVNQRMTDLPLEGIDPSHVSPIDIEMIQVVPPIYGRWHAPQSLVSVNSAFNKWINVLNLDPRHRGAAGLGTEVVRNQQEQLMASAWDQLGQVDRANDLLRRGQLGISASLAIYGRIQNFRLEEFLTVVSPVNRRVLIKKEEMNREETATVSKYLQESRIPETVLDPAFRRISAKRRPFRRRQNSAPETSLGLLERFNQNQVIVAGPSPKPDGMLGLCDISHAMINKLDESLLVTTTGPGPPDILGGDTSVSETALTFRESLLEGPGLFCEDKITPEMMSQIPTATETGVTAETLGWLNQMDPAHDVPNPISLDKLRKAILPKLNPEITIKSMVDSLITLSEVPRTELGVEMILSAPEFSQPMYEPLRDLSQDHILPKVDTVPQNTIGLLKTNSRFVEAYMCGLNHEFAAELMWREYPTDQRGSYFRQFWDVRNTVPPENKDDIALHHDQEQYLASKLGIDVDDLSKEEKFSEKLKDIKPLVFWKDSPLGRNKDWSLSAPVEERDEENLVLLIRGDLLKKYPNTLIYAVRGMIRDGIKVPKLSEYVDHRGPEPGDQDLKYPIFSGTLPTDISFFGFDLTFSNLRDARADGGWFFIIEERVSETRFGLDKPSGKQPENDEGQKSWNQLAWDHFDQTSADSEMEVNEGEVRGIGGRIVNSVISLVRGGETSIPADMHPGEYLNGKFPETAFINGEIEGKTWDANTNSATIAAITMQMPVRLFVHDSRLIPDDIR